MNPDLTTPALDTPEPGTAETVRDYANQMAGEVRDRAEKAFTASDLYVRQNPWPIVLSAAGLGLLVGVALATRREPTARERYIDEPLDHAREVLFALLNPVAGQLQRHYGSVRSAVEEAAERLQEVDAAKLVDPLPKHASRLARKLRFW
jgi:hypothetical protein